MYKRQVPASQSLIYAFDSDPVSYTHLDVYKRQGEDYNGDPNLVYNANQAKYVFRTLYKSTQAAALQDSEKNKFQLRGKFKSSGGDGIPIGAFNVPKGSVVVTAGAVSYTHLDVYKRQVVDAQEKNKRIKNFDVKK